MESENLNDGLRKQIINIIELESPETVEDLITLLQSKTTISKEIILEEVVRLEETDIIDFIQPPKRDLDNIQNYVLSSHAYWFWLSFFISMITAISVYTISGSNHPFIYVRNIFGFIFIVFIPGYNFIRILFPSNNLDLIWRIVLSIGSSLVLVPLVGILINYTPLKISTSPVLISLLIMTLGLSLVALFRDYEGITR